MGLFRRSKNTNTPLLGQILNLIPRHLLQHQIDKHQSDKGCSKYRTFDQLVALTFGQLNKCYSLSVISCGLSVSSTFLSDIGLKQSPAKSTMGTGNKNRSCKVFEGLYFRLLSHYKHLLKLRYQSHIIEEIKNHTIKLIDSTTISLCLSLFDWAKFRTAKGGIKIHTVWDDKLGLPDMVNITEAKLHDRYGLKNHIYEKHTIVVEDRAYFDFELMLQRIKAENIFVTRIKNNTVFEALEELDLPEGKDEDVLKDQIIKLSSPKAEQTGITGQYLRLVSVYKEDEDKVIEIITNQLDWSARTIADLYKKRWDIELFFKAIKQNLQIKTFLGTSENAVKSQIYVALIAYLLLELIRRCCSDTSTAFSNFCEKIRICLMHYLTIDYLCNELKPVVKKAEKPPDITLFDKDNSSKQLIMPL
ncbi:IS4 family transposase [Aestuariivivens sp. NBU2969]|uniref:IS4 family transposase n=1 Tax=Aestuariivivens sp. NBU2969 TaxID=2873267 RepID=UPI001CBFEA5F|nr:IS4 family transposase [Aestuariivivens sp. NBU2969]